MWVSLFLMVLAQMALPTSKKALPSFIQSSCHFRFSTNYEVQITLEVTVLQEGLSIVLGIPMNSRSSIFDVYWVIPLHQPNEDGTTSFPFINSRPLLPKTRHMLNWVLRPSVNVLAQMVLIYVETFLSTATDATFPPIFRTERLQVNNDTDGLTVSITTLQCKACLIRPSCSSTLTFNHRDLVLNPDLDFCENRPEPFIASVTLTLSLAAVFLPLPSDSADLNVYSFGEAGREIVSSILVSLQLCPTTKQWPARIFTQWPNEIQNITRQFLFPPAVF